MADVRLSKINKSFGDTRVVTDLDLHVGDGEFVVLVGPSGCGKSTTLRMVAGLETITSGDLHIGGELVNDIPPKNRNIAMVFQNYALYAHMSVFDNIAFGLKLRRVAKAEIKKRVNHAANVVGMQDYLHRKPKALSGGQRQRVALARAIVREPGVFLFDEPLSNLDAKLRVQMRMEIANIQRQLKTTTLYVTHDQVEAMTMADRIAVLHDGILQQYGPPLELYEHPRNIFVAGFIGSPTMNFIEGSISETRFISDVGDFTFDLTPEQRDKVYPKRVVIGIRPHHILLPSSGGIADPVRFETSVRALEHMGSESFVYFTFCKKEMIARIDSGLNLNPGDQLTLELDRAATHFFAADSGQVIT